MDSKVGQPLTLWLAVIFFENSQHIFTINVYQVMKFNIRSFNKDILHGQEFKPFL